MTKQGDGRAGVEQADMLTAPRFGPPDRALDQRSWRVQQSDMSISMLRPSLSEQCTNGCASTLYWDYNHNRIIICMPVFSTTARREIRRHTE